MRTEAELQAMAGEARIDRALAMLESRERLDARNRRTNNMQKVLDALENCITDLCTFASSPVIIAGVAYSVADRLTRLSAELEAFKARDLLNQREAAR